MVRRHLHDVCVIHDVVADTANIELEAKRNQLAHRASSAHRVVHAGNAGNIIPRVIRTAARAAVMHGVYGVLEVFVAGHRDTARDLEVTWSEYRCAELRALPANSSGGEVESSTAIWNDLVRDVRTVQRHVV